MKSALWGIAILAAGCGGLADSSSGDAGGDRPAVSHVDSGPSDGSKPHPEDAARDEDGRDAVPDARACPSPTAANAWASSPSGTTVDLSGVWGSGPNDVWAVGTNILHWDGSAWSVSTSTMGATAVGGSGPNDVWALAGGAGGGILRWNGIAWSVASSPSDPGDLRLRGAWSSGPGDAWAVGSGAEDRLVVLGSEGGAWSPTNLAPFGYGTLYGVWGTGTSDVWAVGTAFPSPGPPSCQILRWNGSTWTSPSITGPSYPGYLSGVWGSAPGDVWAVGDGVLHWDGATWSPSPVPSADAGALGSLTSVWGTGPCDVWAVGAAGTILHHS